VAEDKGKEEKFDFTSEGEDVGYISLDEARVRARLQARESDERYKERLGWGEVVWADLRSEALGEDYYKVVLQFRSPGREVSEEQTGEEEFLFDLTGTLLDRQVLHWPEVADTTVASAISTALEPLTTEPKVDSSQIEDPNHGLPGVLSGITVEIDGHDAIISWLKPADDGGTPILGYTVDVEELPGKQLSVEEGTQVLMGDLPEGGPYTFTVTAKNENGDGPKSKASPAEVTVPHCDKCGIEVEGDPVTCRECGGGVGPECLAISGLCGACHETAVPVVLNLIQILRQLRAPESPSAVHVSLVPINTDEAVVSWKAPEGHGISPVTGYRVRCVEDSSIAVSTDSATDEHGRCATIVPDVAVGRSYSFIVSAVNNQGESLPSEPSTPITLTAQKLHPLVAELKPGEICTIAGNGKKGYSGDGNLAVNSSLNEPYDVAVDELGNIYIADSGNNRIRKVSVEDMTIDTEVGTGVKGFSGDGINPRNAQLDRPRGIDFDNLGNLYIADRGNHRVHKVDSGSQTIETVAGNGKAGHSGDGQPASSAELDNPESVSVDRATGRVYITGWSGSIDHKRVRMVDGTGTIHTFAGAEKGVKPEQGGLATQVEFKNLDDLVIAAGSGETVYIGEQNSFRLYMVSDTGIMTTIAGRGEKYGGPDTNKGIEASMSPQGLAFYAGDKTIFINDGGSVGLGNKLIRKLDIDSGNIVTVAGTGKSGFEGDGGPATSAKFKQPRGLAVDSYGNLYIADTQNHRVRVIRNP